MPTIGCLVLTPDAARGLDLLLEAGDQLAIGGDQRLLGFDLGDDGLLRGDVVRDRNLDSI
ncbi:MAG: hypothetical protein IPH43_04795 [Xanthomonadales bacterium]|nr:hypothetical protein [Xanthomonadales bacterium]